MGFVTRLSNSPPLRVAVQFENSTPPRTSVIETAANKVQQAVQQAPLLASQLPFFEASKAADWFCGKHFSSAKGARSAQPSGTSRRLRSMTYGSETLIEHKYGVDGRLASTQYHDGETVFYEWDDLTKTNRIRLKSGRQIISKLRPDNQPESIKYDNDPCFQYQYDLAGNITKIFYPDAVSVERSFHSRDRVATMRCGSIFVETVWSQSGELDRHSVQSGTKKCEFDAKARRHICDLTSVNASSGSVHFPLIHSLGVWRLDKPAILQEMLTPWGDRLRVQSSNQNLPTIAWGSSGQQIFHYAPDNSLSAILHSDGSRSVLYQIKNERRSLLISPHGVAFLEFDEQKRLRKLLNYNGDYCLLDYDGNGSLAQLATFIETISILSTQEKRAISVQTSGGFSCKLSYSSDGTLAGLIVSGLQRNAEGELYRLLKFIWRLLGLRLPLSMALA